MCKIEEMDLEEEIMIVTKKAEFHATKDALAADLISQIDPAEWVRMFQLYTSAMRKVQTKLEILDDEFQVKYDHNPIHHMETRIKSERSVLEKCKRRNIHPTIQNIQDHLTDIAGIRVICSYVEDIYAIGEYLIKQEDVELLRRSDYIAEPKENGYRSLHLIIQVPLFLTERTVKVPVEIQLRTEAMDFWASLEHDLHYKTNKHIPGDIVAELKECADTLAALDIKMQIIKNKI